MSCKHETGLFLSGLCITGQGLDEALGTRRSCPDRRPVGPYVVRGPQKKKETARITMLEQRRRSTSPTGPIRGPRTVTVPKHSGINVYAVTDSSASRQ
jgi:hypothetical protein